MWEIAFMAFSEFEQKVFSVCAKTPKGKITTYSELAKAIGKPKAARAVGNALNKNRDPAVPCHRVVLASGKISGFARGQHQKEKLLKREGIRIEGNKIKNFETIVYKFKK